MLFEKNSYGNNGSFEYFIGYKNKTDPFPAPLCIKLEMNRYVNNNKYTNLLVC